MRDAYFPNPDLEIIPLMSQQQRNSITVILVPREWAADVTKSLGGIWEDTGQGLAPADHPIFGNINLGFLTWNSVDFTFIDESRNLPRTGFWTGYITRYGSLPRASNRRDCTTQ